MLSSDIFKLNLDSITPNLGSLTPNMDIFGTKEIEEKIEEQKQEKFLNLDELDKEFEIEQGFKENSCVVKDNLICGAENVKGFWGVLGSTGTSFQGSTDYQGLTGTHSDSAAAYRGLGFGDPEPNRIIGRVSKGNGGTESVQTTGDGFTIRTRVGRMRPTWPEGKTLIQ